MSTEVLKKLIQKDEQADERISGARRLLVNADKSTDVRITITIGGEFTRVYTEHERADIIDLVHKMHEARVSNAQPLKDKIKSITDLMNSQ